MSFSQTVLIVLYCLLARQHTCAYSELHAFTSVGKLLQSVNRQQLVVVHDVK